jgi:hypothetical protein
LTVIGRSPSGLGALRFGIFVLNVVDVPESFVDQCGYVAVVQAVDDVTA